MSDNDFFEIEVSIANGIVAKLNAAPQTPVLKYAMTLLLGRIIESGNSLRVLGNESPENFGVDGAMILRGVYDASLQALYILADESKCEERAQLYLDYGIVEQWRESRRFVNSTTDMGRMIASSPKRGPAELALEKEFNRVQHLFSTTKRGKETERDHWYRGNLRNLAEEVGLVDEYDLFQKQFSGYVHSSAYSLDKGPFPHSVMFGLCWRFSFRVLGKLAECTKTPLEQLERERIQRATGNAYNMPNPSTSVR